MQRCLPSPGTSLAISQALISPSFGKAEQSSGEAGTSQTWSLSCFVIPVAPAAFLPQPAASPSLGLGFRLSLCCCCPSAMVTRAQDPQKGGWHSAEGSVSFRKTRLIQKGHQPQGSCRKGQTQSKPSSAMQSLEVVPNPSSFGQDALRCPLESCSNSAVVPVLELHPGVRSDS